MISRRVLRVNDIKMFVLDEADEMLSRGFKDQIYDVFRTLNPNIQVVLLSATMPPDVLEVSFRNMKYGIHTLNLFLRLLRGSCASRFASWSRKKN